MFENDHLSRIKAEIADSFDEELEMQLEEEQLDALVSEGMSEPAAQTIERRIYFRELFRLQHELVKLQDWVQHNKLKMVVLFEGRDSAGKGGAIKRVTQRLNPRVCRVVALPAPTERERNQWYFQRYAAHLPSAGEMVLFDRSWYNRAGVERVMGFCTGPNLRSSSARCRNSSACWCVPASSSSNTGSRSPTTSRNSASACASTIR
jgi:polyphosphate kinase 2 (PPK2 family)